MKLAAFSDCLLTVWKPGQVVRPTTVGMRLRLARAGLFTRTNSAGRITRASGLPLLRRYPAYRPASLRPWSMT